MSNFSGYEKNLMDTVQWQYGDTVEWTPFGGGAMQTALGLFNEPDRPSELQGVNYEDSKPTVEYRMGQFTGLKEAADAHSRREVLKVIKDGTTREFIVLKVKKKLDGDTYVATIEPKKS